ncbi:MAG: hypothetical protein WC284_14755 [Candidimonas sp.]
MIKIPTWFLWCNPKMMKKAIEKRSKISKAFRWSLLTENQYDYWSNYRHGYNDTAVDELRAMYETTKDFSFTLNMAKRPPFLISTNVPFIVTDTAVTANDMVVDIGEYNNRDYMIGTAITVMSSIIGGKMKRLKILPPGEVIMRTKKHLYGDGKKITT